MKKVLLFILISFASIVNANQVESRMAIGILAITGGAALYTFTPAAFLITVVAPASAIMTNYVVTGLDKELIENARDDAAEFLSTEGEIRGANLIELINSVRTLHGSESITDADIAIAVLSN